MKKYELLTVIKANIDIDGIEQIIQNIEGVIKNNGGQVLNVDKIGRKRLAYEVDKSRDGFYVNITFETAEDKIKDLRKYLKLNENVIRELVTVVAKARTKTIKARG